MLLQNCKLTDCEFPTSHKPHAFIIKRTNATLKQRAICVIQVIIPRLELLT